MKCLFRAIRAGIVDHMDAPQRRTLSQQRLEAWYQQCLTVEGGHDGRDGWHAAHG